MIADGSFRDRRWAIPVDAAVAALPRILARSVRAANGCLICSLTPSTVYPTVRIGSREICVHRVVLTVKLGRPFEGLALHQCDNKRCVEADHLYEGDHAQNMRDRNERAEQVGRPSIDPLLVKRFVGSVMSARQQAYMAGVCRRTVDNHRCKAKRDASPVLIEPVKAADWQPSGEFHQLSFWDEADG